MVTKRKYKEHWTEPVAAVNCHVQVAGNAQTRQATRHYAAVIVTQRSKGVTPMFASWLPEFLIGFCMGFVLVIAIPFIGMLAVGAMKR